MGVEIVISEAICEDAMADSQIGDGVKVIDRHGVER